MGGLVAGFAILTVAGLLRRRKDSAADHDADARSAWLVHGLAMAVEQVEFVGVLLAAGLVGVAAAGPSPLSGWLSAAGIGSLMAVALWLLVLVPRWQREWLVYLSQAALVGAYVLYRLAHPLDLSSDSAILTLFAFIDLGIAEVLDRLRLPIYARPTRYASLVLPVLPLVHIVGTRGMGDLTVFHLVSPRGPFTPWLAGRSRWKTLGTPPGYFTTPRSGCCGDRWAGSSPIIPSSTSCRSACRRFCSRKRTRELGRETVNTVRTAGLIVTYLAMAAPIWQDRSFGDWVALLLGSLVGLFFGIGLRVQTFVWLGLVTFLLDVLYELGRVSLDHALAKWAIMLSLGILLVFFVALNEKKQIVQPRCADISRKCGPGSERSDGIAISVLVALASAKHLPSS